jgi:hypothetical protein
MKKMYLRERDFPVWPPYLDESGGGWQLYPVEGFRHSPCIVCGQPMYGLDFWQNLQTGDCVHNQEQCVHVEPYNMDVDEVPGSTR